MKKMTEAQTQLMLVFGASGYIGTHLVEHLRLKGYRVRASARHVKVIEARGWGGVQCVQGDALKPDTLATVLKGVDTAYYLVHSMAAGRDFGRLDLQAAEFFRVAAAAAGVRRIIYLGGLIPKHPESEHLQSRLATGDCLRQGAVPVTEIRAGMIVGAGSAAFEVMRDLVNYLPIMITPRWVQSKSPPIALADLLIYMERLGFIDEAAGQIYDAGGSEVLSYQEIIEQLSAILGRKPVIITVPVLTPRLSSYWLRLVTAVPVNIASALVDGLRHDVLADSEPLRKLVPRNLMSFEQSVRAALVAEKNQSVPAHWVEGSMRCRRFEPRYAFYAKQAEGSCTTCASMESLWAQLCRIGRNGDFFSMNALWWCRRVGDWLLGGPSFRRKRRHLYQLRYGDVVDAWRVIGYAPPHKLTLLMEMKAPGSGVLEFEVGVDQNGKQKVTATAYFHPAGFWGLLYWYPLVVVHMKIFKGMTAEICRRAEQQDKNRAK